MTNRDPHNTEFERKFLDYSDCLTKYWKISDVSKLKKDLEDTSLELVCFFEKKQVLDHLRNSKGHFSDFTKMTLEEEVNYQKKLDDVYTKP